MFNEENCFCTLVLFFLKWETTSQYYFLNFRIKSYFIAKYLATQFQKGFPKS